MVKKPLLKMATTKCLAEFKGEDTSISYLDKNNDGYISAEKAPTELSKNNNN